MKEMGLPKHLGHHTAGSHKVLEPLLFHHYKGSHVGFIGWAKTRFYGEILGGHTGNFIQHSVAF